MSDVCKNLKKLADTKNTVNSIKDASVKKITDVRKQVTSAGKNAIKDITQRGRSKYKVLNSSLSGLDAVYSFISGNKSKRPDLIFFRNVLVFLAAVVIVYYTLPRLSGSANLGFSKDQFTKATKLPQTSFNIEETAKVNLEVKAFTDHKKFFDDGGAYDPANAGLHELSRTSVALPMLIFFLQFVVPPLAIGYIVWFVITYWRYVIAALWGFFETMYSYFTNLIQGRLGCKWYIRWVTKWRCNSPVFSEYIARWRRQYIDGPMYAEKVKYINQYNAAKEKYVTTPYKKYIDEPIARRKIETEYTKRIATDRTVEVILKKSRDTYDTKIASKGWFKGLFGSTGWFGSGSKDSKGSKGWFGSGSKGWFGSGSKGWFGSGSKGNEEVSKTPQLTVPKLNLCDKADKLINNRASITGTLIVIILAVLIGIYYYSWTFGTPVFVKNLISQTNIVNLSKVKYKRWPIAPYVVLATTIAIIAHTGFS